MKIDWADPSTYPAWETRRPWPGLPLCIDAKTMTEAQMRICLTYVVLHDEVFLEALFSAPAPRVRLLSSPFVGDEFRKRHPWFFELPLDHRENVSACITRIESLGLDTASLLRDLKREVVLRGRDAKKRERVKASS